MPKAWRARAKYTRLITHTSLIAPASEPKRDERHTNPHGWEFLLVIQYLAVDAAARPIPSSSVMLETFT